MKPIEPLELSKDTNDWIKLHMALEYHLKEWVDANVGIPKEREGKPCPPQLRGIDYEKSFYQLRKQFYENTD